MFKLPTPISKALLLLMVGFACIATAALVAGDRALSPALGIAHEYNGFFLDDFTSTSSSIEGRLAAGGVISLNHFALGKRLRPPHEHNSLVAGKDIHFPSGRIFNGSILAGGSTAGIGSGVVNRLANDQSVADHADLPFNFIEEFNRLVRLSLNLSTLQHTGTTKYEWGGLYLEGDCHSARQIFSLDGAELIQAHSLKVSCIPAGATVILNISGAQSGLANMGLQNLKSFAERTLFNFHEATQLTFNSVSINGSVLAPYAQVDANSGSVHGSVFARSWAGNMNLQHLPFSGNLPDLSSDNELPRPFWLAAGNTVVQLSPGTAVADSFEEVARDIKKLMVNSYGNHLIALSDSGLHIWTMDQNLSIVEQTDVSAAGIDAFELNAYTGELAYAGENTANIIELSSRSQVHFSVPGISAIAAGGENRSFYTASGSEVVGWGKQQEELTRFDVGFGVEHLVYDSGANRLWVQGEGELRSFTATGAAQAAAKIANVTEILATQDGGLWLQANGQLVIVHSSGKVQELLELDSIDAWAVDAAHNTLWLVSRNRIVHIDQVGHILGSYPISIQHLDKGIVGLGIYADVYPPKAVITYPENETELDEASFVLTFDYHDPGLGINENEVLLALDGKPLEVECDFADGVGECFVPNLEDGGHTIQLSLQDKAGNETSEIVSFTIDTSGPDLTPLSMTIESPTDGTFTNQDFVTLAGYLNKSGSVTVNGEPIHLDIENRFQATVSLQQGANSLKIVAVDSLGRDIQQTFTIVLDTTLPEAPDASLLSTTSSGDGTVTVHGSAGSVEPESQVVITNIRTGDSVTATATNNGAFNTVIAAEVGDELQIVTADRAGNTSGATPTTVTDLPPDPAVVAPPLSETGITPFNDAVAFLYSGSNPVQSGVQAGVIEARRVAVIRGQVLDKQNNPLSGVTVTVKDHTEFGQTRSRSDGNFDLAVNGGGYLTLDYQKEGYLPVQRKVNAPWREYAFAQDVVMIQLDPQVAAIDLNSPAMQVAQGSPQTDADGTRQATLLFPAGTTATMTLANGSTQELSTLNVRATEYTVGENGPEFMPGELPPASAYTYAVELSVDEALAAGADRIDFNQPVPLYVDNFIDFPTGETVPLGYYDRTKAAWIASESGRVIEILTIENNQAVVDVTGDGVPATQAQLDELAITDPELQKLAEIYSAGNTLWRSPIPHFTPWDCNWPYGPPHDAESPPNESPETPDDDQPEDTDDENECEGCIISPQAQTLAEKIPVVGTPFSLHYRSDRVAGRKNNTVVVPISGSSVPTSLQSISVTVEIAGQRLRRIARPAAGLSETFEWDGLDAYGRPVYGNADATVTVAYYYPCIYRSGNNGFGQFGSSSKAIGTRTNCRGFIFPRTSRVVVKSPLSVPAAIGNWTLSAEHSLILDQLFEGDGSKRATAKVGVIDTVAGDGTSGYGFFGEGGLATEAQLSYPTAVAIDAVGNLYIADAYANRVLRVGHDGIITTVAGTGSAGLSGDGGPATEADLNWPNDLAVDSAGNLYISEESNARVRRVSPDGIITTVAGTVWTSPRQDAFAGDGGPAVEAKLGNPGGVAVDANGNIFIADTGNKRIRRIDSNGVITTIAGNGGMEFDGDGGPAHEAALNYPRGVAVDAAGSIYIADTANHRIRRVDAAGIISTVAGTGEAGYSGDGGPAIEARLDRPYGLAVDDMGNVYIADMGNGRIRRIDANGVITTVTGKGGRLYGYDYDDVAGDRGAASEAVLGTVHKIALDKAGNLYIPGLDALRVRKVEAVGQYVAALQVASKDGTQQFIFDESGRHLRTADTITGETLYTFDRNAEGQLITITDVNGQTTPIERDENGEAGAIIAPTGQRTEFLLSRRGHLVSVTNPAGESYAMTYSEGGLLTSFTDRNGQVNQFEYDFYGRLTSDRNPAGGGWTLERTQLDSGYQTTMTTAEGLQSIFTVEPQAVGGRIQRQIKPDGTVQEKHFVSAEDKTTQPDGTVVTRVHRPDPRFGMQSPVVDATINTPAGLTSTTDRELAAVLSDAANPLSLESLNDTTTINGRVFQNEYQAVAQAFTLTSPEGRKSTRQINEKGQPVRIQTAGLVPNTLAYNERGRLAQAAVGEGADARVFSFSYDAQGNLQSVTDPLHRVVSYNYDLAGRVTKQTFPDGRSVDYQYDANGNLTSIAPPGREAHVFSYTAVDLEENYAPPAISGTPTVTNYQYDRDKKLTAIERPDGRTVAFSYDFGGRLAETAIERGTYAYAYDATTGQRSQVTAPDGGTIAYAYDGFLPLSQTWSGEIAGSVTRNYDNNFWLTERCVNQTSCVDFAYDDDGLLTQAGLLTANRHAQHGLITDTSLGAIQTQRGYNSFGEIINYGATVGEAALMEFAYDRDAVGRITDKSENTPGGAISEVYDYDATGRLTRVTRNGVPTTWSYDANGNRTHENGDQIATYDSQDRLLTFGSTSYSYTENGELQSTAESGVTTTYDYDELGNLLAMSLPGDVTIRYLIDGQNRRIGKRVNGELKQGFLYGDQLNPVAELDASGAIVARFVYGTKPHVPDYMIKGDKTYRIVSDHLGSPRLIVDIETGEVAQEMEYDVWGKVLHDSNPGFQPFGFAGGLYDQHTGLVRFGARDYDPETGRWTAKDPIKFKGGDANLYAYVLTDPVSFIDPYGLQAQACYRPLGAFPLAVVGAGSSVDRSANTVIGHEHIFFEDGSDIGFGRDGLYSGEDKSEYSSCEDMGAGQEDIMKVVDEIREDFKPDNYQLFGNNCQAFVDAVRGGL